MKNVGKRSKHFVLIFLSILVVLCLLTISAILLIQNVNVKSTNQQVEDMVERYLVNLDLQETYDGEYSVDVVQQVGECTFAVVRYAPSDGQGSLYMLAIEKKNGEMIISDKTTAELPMSMGVSVCKFTALNKTIVFGAVTDKIWLDLNAAPEKVEFTNIKVLYSNGKEQSASVSNFQTFMICIDNDVYIDDVLFLTNNETVGKLSKLPIGNDVIVDFNMQH